MNSLRLRFFLLTLALTGTGAAHPGPVGHRHGEEWPFGGLEWEAPVLALMGALVFLALARRKEEDPVRVGR